MEASSTTEEPVAVLRTVEAAKDAYRQKDLRQCLYDAGDVVMHGVLVNLHGTDHRARRRLENRLFRRDVLDYYEHELFPAVIAETLSPYVEAGRAELVSLGHQLMMNLAAVNAGVDRPRHTPAATFRLYEQMMKFIQGATLGHSLGDRSRLRAEIAQALAAFDEEFLQPSIDRRHAIIDAVASGQAPEATLPRDILTILLQHEDDALPREVILREIAFFLLAGAHTSAMSFTRTLHHIFEWTRAHPEDADRVRSDPAFVQRCVLESIRLFPSSPIGMRRALTDVTLADGTIVQEGATVVIDLMAVNRDESVFGQNADEFDPYRAVDPAMAGAPGLSFGHGMHACIGQELAAGTWRSMEQAADPEEERQYGLVTVAVQAMIDAGAHPDPDEAAVPDHSTARHYWGRYPVIFGPVRSALNAADPGRVRR